MKEDLVHLHTHSDMSALDGCAKISEYVEKAVERGHPAFACTDHGTMRGFYQLVEETKGKSVKPIFGVEFYVAADMRRHGLSPEEKEALTRGLPAKEAKDAVRAKERSLGMRGNWHLTAWALNNEGLKNLFRLSSLAWTEGFYYRPRIDLSVLESYSKGVAIGTACVSGFFHSLLREGHERFAVETGDMLHDIFGSRMWLEIMPHDLDEQRQANRDSVLFAKRWKRARLLATQDAHYLNKEDARHHEIMLCVGTHGSFADPTHFRFTGDHYWMKTRREMEESFAQYHPELSKAHVREALDNTLCLAEQVETHVEANPFACYLPPVEIPSGYKDDFQYLQELCLEGWRLRDIESRAKRVAPKYGKSKTEMWAVYSKRLVHELKALRRQKFAPYFLIVRDMYSWARQQKIACGPGRGSAAGSLVAYLLGITSVDPLEHDLLFERFINPARINMPDIDCDFEDTRRDEVFRYLEDKYGEHNCARIATVGRMTAKQVVKDVGRVLDIPFAELNQLTAAMEDELDVAENFEKVRRCAEFNEAHPAVLHHAKRLEGMAKNLGVHAAGFVMAPKPLTEYLPLESRDHRTGKPVKVTAVDMRAVEDLGLLKLDILGLRTMTVIRKTLESVKAHTGEDIDLEALPLDDVAVLQGFTEGDTIGVFQFNTHAMERITAGVRFDSFEDIAAFNALVRPGTARSGLTQDYLKRKVDPEKISEVEFHPKVSEITKKTLGVIVYQEDVVRILTDVAGFDPSEADKTRKKIGKTEGAEEVEKIRDDFVVGACATTPGMDPETANKLMDAIAEFGGYAFNRSHAVAYGMIAYWCMWLKLHHPLEFYCALLECEPDRNKIRRIVRRIVPKGVEVLPPDVSVSGVTFKIDRKRDAIRGSLQDVRDIGDKAAQEIMENQPYSDFFDFLDRTNRRSVNKRTVKSLAISGALDSLLPNPLWFVENLDKEIWPKVAKKKKRAELEVLIHESARHPQWDPEARAQAAAKVNPLAFGSHPLDLFAGFLKEHIKVPFQDLNDPEFYKTWGHGQSCYIVAVAAEIKEGRFERRSEAEGEKYGWVEPYANVYLEDEDGKRHRMSIDWNIYNDHLPLLTEGEGDLIVALVKPSEEYQSMRAHFAISIPALKTKLEAGKKKLTVWEEIVLGKHPAQTYPWKLKASRRAALQDMYRRSLRAPGTIFKATGVIANLRPRIDKRGQEMVFFFLVGASGTIPVTCFGSAWPSFRRALKPGRFVTLQLERQKRNSNILSNDYGKIWTHGR